ncbi:SDR family NAD(P)-dependent oxidoreductase [Alkalihalobacillus trypoxylicola]|uniref:Oxidoreductase n=1 Tax=Alkalihalobacillus trypoxylicola TaxID=519424 RepID=A0A161PD19_9BACI|nr:SDR family oxidoreductase [Alkalihalobacillus trypoxylicola]KYG25595.1 oxidoreductase [Alkalihalobacillus trypoxylicola]
MKFQDKVVLITGASGGIGIKTAKLFENEGARLALVDLDKGRLENSAKEEGLNLSESLLLSGNVGSEDEVQAFVKETVNHFGRIDVFINNAGINGHFGDITEQSIENFQNVMNVNATGVFLGLKHVMKVMKEQQSGAIVNTASNGGLLGSPGMAPYIASKHAVIGLTKSAALEGAPHQIRVNAVAPSGVDTAMVHAIEKNASPDNIEEARKQFKASVPMNRYATAEEIGKLMMFLASDDASFISGSYYRIDGGQGATSV